LIIKKIYLTEIANEEDLPIFYHAKKSGYIQRMNASGVHIFLCNRKSLKIGMLVDSEYLRKTTKLNLLKQHFMQFI